MKMSSSFNCGIVGRSGCGKSSLINALRSMQCSHPGAAKVGVTETTTYSTPYTDPIDPNITYWDLPGLGTKNFPTDEDFLETIEFQWYSFFIIVMATRFTSDDAWIAKQICAAGKQFVFVRTKLDIDLRNERREYPSTFNEERLLNEIREECDKSIRDNGLGWQKIYLVSCQSSKSLDLFELLQDIHSIYEYV